MKGIILAGGSGSRLYPCTKIMTKQLQPIYDKPMIYYPLSLLMSCSIREIAIITTIKDLRHFKLLLGDGSFLGISLTYIYQEKPEGLAQAYTLSEEFLNNCSSMMILGDNFFYGNFNCFKEAMSKHLSVDSKTEACIFAYHVVDPSRYGVVEFDKVSKEVLSIEEKPITSRSNYVIPGLYIFDKTASSRVKKQKMSQRGEFEITDLIQTYLDEGTLSAEIINKEMIWLDTGTPESLLEASSLVASLEQRQNLKVGCIEEVALRMNFINSKQLETIVKILPCSPYREYLEAIINEF